MCGPSHCVNEWRNGCVDRVNEEWVCGPSQCGNKGGNKQRNSCKNGHRQERVKEWERAGPTKTRLKKGQFTETDNFLSRRTTLVLTCLLR